jgi:hypothetical protein
MKFDLDYNNAVHLDAEALAETGIAAAYQTILKTMCEHIPEPAAVHEIIDSDAPSYAVRYADREYVIYSPTLPEDSWGRATHALFQIINDQLLKSIYKLYAINGGNDLDGMLLTQAECEAARKSLPHKEDWPYLPTLEHPWYGKYHD